MAVLACRVGIFSRKHRTHSTNQSQPVLRCSFCHKNEQCVRKLIAGPTVFICNECVDCCNDIIADDARLAAAAVVDGEPASERAEIPASEPVVQCALCRMPVTASDGLSIQNRGLLCVWCLDEIEAAIDERPQQRSDEA